MSGADASIYGNLRPAQPIEGPVDQYSKLLALKNAQGQNDLADLQRSKLTNDLQEEQDTKNVFRNAPTGATLQDLLPDLMKASPTRGVTFQKTALENQKNQGEIAHTAAQTGEIQAGQVAGHLAALTKDPSDQGVQTMADLMASHGIPAPVVDGLKTKLLALPPELRAPWATAQAAVHPAGQKALELLFPQAHMQDAGGTVTPVSTSTLPGQAAPGSAVPGGVTLTKTASPDAVMTDARARSEGAANRAVTQAEGAANRNNRLTVAGLDASGNPKNMVAPGQHIDMAQVSPADIEAAWRYNQDGTLPPNMGRGQQGANESLRLRTIAAQINQTLGISPEDARSNQLAFKGSGQAITQLVKKEAQIGANVRNFDYNAGQVLDLSQQVDRTGVPIANAWLNAGRRSVTGNPQLAAFDTAVKTTVNEFAQIVSGATGGSTQGEKEKAEKLLSAAQTPEQIVAVVNQMRNESQNRMKSFADQKQATLASMRAKAPASGAPAATTTTAAAPGALVATVKNDDDYNKLKSGTQFVGPDGKTRTKP